MTRREEAIVDLLLKKGLITDVQLGRVKDEMARTGLGLEKAVDRLGFVTETEIVNLSAEAMGVVYVNLEDYLIDPEVAHIIPEDLARKYRVVPLFKVGDTLTVAMANPKDIMAIDEIRVRSKVGLIEPVLSTEKQIGRAIEECYSVFGSVEDIMKTIDSGKISLTISEDAEAKVLAKEAEQAPVVRLVNMMITQAVKEKASDIHVEPEESKVRVRYRIDGILREASILPKHLQMVIISRIKIISKMDISETRKPQDGRMQLKMENKRLDLRVSSFPTIHGENIVMRILDRSSTLITLPQLGLGEAEHREFDRIIRFPYGIILVTGPTGSGKTTTLYAALSAINSMELNIITIEDPVEYELPLIRQTQMNSKAGLTFSTGLRAILRQDPDVVMVGEIRDHDTAEVAVQASLTGHLVFSTLHTNDAPSSLLRLIDMGIEPFLISTSVIGILAQRLVRAVCRECKESYRPLPELLHQLKIEGDDIIFYRGKGCKACRNTGYAGRIGIFEFMPVSDEVRRLIVERPAADVIRAKAEEEGMRCLRKDGIEKAKAGLTTLEEVLRVTEAT